MDRVERCRLIVGTEIDEWRCQYSCSRSSLSCDWRLIDDERFGKSWDQEKCWSGSFKPLNSFQSLQPDLRSLISGSADVWTRATDVILTGRQKAKDGMPRCHFWKWLKHTPRCVSERLGLWENVVISFLYRGWLLGGRPRSFLPGNEEFEVAVKAFLS